MTDIVLTPITGANNLSNINNNFDKIESSINKDVVQRSGGNNTMNQSLDMNSHKILNIATDVNDPESLLDVQTADSRYYNVAGDTLAGPMNVSGQVISGLPLPVSATSPVRKQEFDSALFDSATELRTRLADGTTPGNGASLVAWKRQPLAIQINNVHQMLDGLSYNIWEFVDYITDKPDLNNPSTWDWQPAFQAAVNLAGVNGLDITVPAWAGFYTVKSSINILVATTGTSGITIRGVGTPRDCQIRYTGAGYCFNIKGTGTEDDSPITRFNILNFWINGNANTTSIGGFDIERVYIVRIQDVFSTNWGSASANSVSIRNCFNVEWDGGHITNGSTTPVGTHALIVGSESPSAWNSSNIQFRNTLIQYAGTYGVRVLQDASVLDNLTLDNVSLGKNGQWSIFSDSANVNNITLRNCHLESPGYNTTSTPNANTGHILITAGTSLDISNSSFQDALTYISLDSVRAFDVGRGNKFFETGAYTLTGNTLLKIRTTTGNCVGYWGANEVRTDQIDNLFDLVNSGGFRIDLGRQTHTTAVEAFWNSEIVVNPLDYRGTIIDRFASTTAPFDRMVSDGTSWYRYMLTSMYKGERTAIPVTVEGVGSFYLNKNGTLQGTSPNQYIVFGWYTVGGGTWYPMRFLTGT